MAGNENCPNDTVKLQSFIGVELSVPGWEAVLIVVVFSFIIIVTIVGNILVIVSVFSHKPLQIPHNYFLASLAVADLTVAMFVLPLSIVDHLLGYWRFGSHLCKVWKTCDVLCCTASILHICVIAVDRYWSITDPLHSVHNSASKRVLTMISGVWIISIIISSPPLAGWNNWPTEFNETTKCRVTFEHGYRIYSSLGSFYIPLFITSIVYLEIYIAIKKRLKERKRKLKLHFSTLDQRRKEPIHGHQLQDFISESSETTQCDASIIHEEEAKSVGQRLRSCISWKNSTNYATSGECSRGADLEEKQDETKCTADLYPRDDIAESPRRSTNRKSSKLRRSSQPDVNSPFNILLKASSTPIARRKQHVVQKVDAKKKISLSKDRRAVRTLGIIVGVFVVCWLPAFLLYVIVPFCDSCCPSENLSYFLTWLGYVNSALNPLIYTIFNIDFRKAFKKMLRCKKITFPI